MIESNRNNQGRVRAGRVQRGGIFATDEKKNLQADQLCNHLDKKEGRKIERETERERAIERSRMEDEREK